MNTSRIYSRILCAILAVTSLSTVACQGSATTAETTAADTTAGSTETEVDLEPLVLPEGLDYKGYKFRVLTREAEQQLSQMYIEEQNGNIVDDAVYERLQTVEELLNVEIEVIGKGAWYNNDAMSTINAGDDAYDLILTHGRSAFIYAAGNCNHDLNTVENLNLGASWWNQDMRENFEINGKLYAAGSSITTQTLGSTMCMIFSHPLLTDYGIEFPYQLVRDGKWTWEVFEKYVKNFSQDLNGDSKISLENDLLGYSFSGWTGAIGRFYTTGAKTVTPDKDGYPKITLYNERTVELCEKLFALADSDYAELDLDNKFKDTSFREGRLAFNDIEVRNIMSLSDVEQDFGILPYPKFDESLDRYYSIVEAGADLALIPITVSDTARAGAITEALTYYGHKLVLPAYYDNALLNRYLRDEDSVEMMELIRQSQTYDLGYFNQSQFGGALANPGYSLAANRTLTLTTLYEGNKAAVEALIEKSMEFYTQE